MMVNSNCSCFMLGIQTPVIHSRSEATTVRLGNRTVGIVMGDEFIKKIRGSKHILHTPRALAFDVTTLKQACAAGAKWVRVIDTETSNIYRASLSLIFDKGFSFNRGYGDQLGLEMRFWTQGEDPLGEQMRMWS